MKRKHIILNFITISLLSISGYSADLDIKAFGTISGVYNNNGNYIYRKDIFQKDGSSNDLSFETDTLIGLQTIVNINENYSFALQGIVNNNCDDKIEAKIDWGYLKYDSNENIIIKLGKIRTPYYRNSENLNIGYSNLMIRESVEVYGQVPFSSYNGVEFIYSDIISRYFYTIQAGYGAEELSVPIHSLNQKANVDVNNLYAVNLTFGTDALQLRTTYLNADITASNISIDQLFTGLRAFGFNDLANRYEFKNTNSEYLGFGLFIDYKNFIFSSEYAQRRIPSFFADTHGYYITFGYNFNRIIPFITYSKSKMDTATYEANTVSNELNALLHAQNLAQTSKLIGIKYYVNENVDLKFQYENIKPIGEFGSYYLSSLQYPQTLNVFSFAMDFIF
ncbi:MAG: hypothetical protein A2513_08130 [Sulfurimonas sp. RIFOXYD12_FULL_33_39]|uniref:hypothetical protein n=1 Tax=unclassified Sulfurimonas TaxID=2623549 RepID=UPI0008B9EB3B|nr:MULTISPECIES: hypothetical protein [unclassified Sulfurimonas]OHE03122.1 MAG: hypothetical protein A3G74_04670 [Sulfurimonas sp. RIFCSPLOWO2_12_FULL_34_6]OHE10055.1 MAG: hypothetical protein A2513_08130 [Sulfurimonas sp. RIFOXYD12_FULL_33_39]OHE14724.1 MAG: hypothetical protein A2530_02350 [Sulfurimonas sp. RIFOXYD2_FULL_34_21]